MASLFGELQLREKASSLEIPDLEEKLHILQQWRDDYHVGTLKQDNETAREQAYNHDIFGRVLGYVEKPNIPYTFEPKSSTGSGQIPDARIGWFDPKHEVNRTIAVVELKGASTPLDRPQRGHGNLSPVQQGFKYRPQYRGCEFVVVSNFFELRLYNDNELDYEAWTLDELTDPADSYIKFRVFYLILASQQFVSPAGKTPAQGLMLDIRGQQEEIGRRFYDEYSQVRANLAESIWQLNKDKVLSPEMVIEKAQKILDRLVFTCFAEDRGLIRENTVARVLGEAEQSSFGSIWSTFRGFFSALDAGSVKLQIPVGFNGGLFAEDRLLDSLDISDSVLRSAAKLSRYNFSEDLSVSVLGHIFEKSIADLQDLQEAASSAGEISRSVLSLRKTSGVFYTPSQTVKGIIDGSLGRYLRKAEESFLKKNSLQKRLGDKKYEERVHAAYQQYQAFLHSVTVLDPACGSGAFLVGALDHLVAEHERVARILGNDLFSSDEYIRLVLQQNLFGVDINPGSIEITKLSLWLKSARRGQKLTTLDQNIKCGNSLISDPSVVGSLSFDWDVQFPAAKSGGFDVVVGNPPYVDSETMVQSAPGERAHISTAFETAKGNWDLFVPFYQRAFDLTKPGGICSMIIPNKVISMPYAQSLREYIDKAGDLTSIADVSTDGIFDVDVYPVVVTVIKQDATPSVELLTELGSEANVTVVQASAEGDWVSLFVKDRSESGMPLADVARTFAAATVSESYELKAVLRDDRSGDSDDIRVVNTGTIDPYTTDWGLFPMKYLKSTYQAPVVAANSLPYIKPWLKKSFVAVAGMSRHIEAVVAGPNEFLPAKSTVVVVPDQAGLDAYALVALLNSEPFRSRFNERNQFSSMSGGYISIDKTKLGKAPVPANLLDIADELSCLGKQASEARRLINAESRKLKTILISEFGSAAWPKRLQQWWVLDDSNLLKAIRVKTTLAQRAEVLELFGEMKANIASARESFDNALTEIDRLVEGGYVG